jgi:hypothetical protein
LAPFFVLACGVFKAETVKFLGPDDVRRLRVGAPQIAAVRVQPEVDGALPTARYMLHIPAPVKFGIKLII